MSDEPLYHVGDSVVATRDIPLLGVQQNMRGRVIWKPCFVKIQDTWLYDVQFYNGPKVFLLEKNLTRRPSIKVTMTRKRR